MEARPREDRYVIADLVPGFPFPGTVAEFRRRRVDYVLFLIRLYYDARK